MYDATWIDFYHNWLIEVIETEDGFTGICYSPTRQKIELLALYASRFEAWRAAQQKIDQYFACAGLSSWLRDLYETGQLPLDEWQALHRSLATIITKSV